MGVDVYSYGYIGLKIKGEDILEMKKVKAFEHDYPENYKLCPMTGVALWRYEEVLRSGFENKGYDEFKFGQFDIAQLDFDSNEYIIILQQVRTGSHRNGDFVAYTALPTAELTNLFKAKCKEFNLWKDSNFGLWVKTSVS